MEIPGYEILEKLGEGGTATVWKARQVALDRLVALKVMHKTQTTDDAALDRFRTEGLAAAKLGHRNIVQVFDAGEVNGSPYFAMEFVEGQSIGDIIARKGKLKADEALAVAESVAVALKHAWNRAQIIHCDIKPDNILVEKYGVVKVADLGLARILSHREGHAERDVIGTPNYVSPEQAQGGVDLDYRSDVYSLGATLYHMVTGIMPFAGASGIAAMDMHISQFLRDPLEINAELSPTVAWLIEKMMIRNRADRYASWSEVIDDIDAVINGGMPLPPLPEAGHSTVSRCAARVVRAAPAPAPANDSAPPPAPRKAAPAAEKEVYEESPNVAVNPAAMRAKLGQVMNKHQPPPMTPANIVLKFAVSAGVAVVAYWMWTTFMHSSPPPKTDGQNAETPFIHPAGGGTSAPEAAPAPPPPPVNSAYTHVERTTNELMVIHNKASLAWDDAEYTRAASLYNNALIAYGNYLDKRENPANLKRIENNLHTAVDFFEKCKERAPAKYDVQGYIDKCNKLIFDVHSTMTISP